jgi:hypothetical protein
VARAFRLAVVLCIVLATAAPVLEDANDDSYPFSTYPMFARQLGKPRLVYAEGLKRGGAAAVRLPPELVGTDEPMQAMRTLGLTADRGRRPLRRLCAAIAARVTRVPEYADVWAVSITRASFDPLRYFEGDAAPERPKQLARCEVGRK